LLILKGEIVKNKSVAVLDIRSSEICAVVGERGVNNTFVIKSKYTCAYDGFAEGELLDVEGFNSAVSDVVKSTLSAIGEKIKVFFVGVPAEFLKIENTDKSLSFSQPRKITERDKQSLCEFSRPKIQEDYTYIKHSPVYYVLSDKRRVIEPVGIVSDSLRGKLTFYLCKTSFLECVAEAFNEFESISDLRFIPQNYAEAAYLISPEQRDSCAVLFDMGYISSCYSVACGNGLLFSEGFSVGIGHVAVHLMNELDIPFEVATYFLSKVNLNAKEKLTSVEEYKFDGKNYSFSTATLRDIIREGLDGICETIETCRQSYTGKDISTKPILFTGEGVKTIRGTAEHISSRLVTSVEVVAPKLPYYDKPQFSSLFSLLSAALSER
jgi:cell division ATPase FtsA